MKKNQAKTAIVVSIWKSGTNLMLKSMQHLGFECRGAGTGGAIPGSGTNSADFERITSELLAGKGLPDGIALFLHQLPVEEIPMPVARLYASDPEGLPLIFNYRDPRATLASAVNYLRRDPAPDHHASYLFLAPILAKFSSTKDARPQIKG